MKRRENNTGSLSKKASGRYLAQAPKKLGRGSKVFQDRNTALAYLNEVSKPALLGSTDAGTLPLCEFGAYAVEIKGRTLRPKTAAQYESVFRCHIEPGLGGLRLKALTAKALNQFLLGYLEQGGSPRTARVIYTVLNVIFTQALKEGALFNNPMEGVFHPKYEIPERRPYSLTEAQAFREAIRGDDLELLYYLGIGKGPRSGELLGLAWHDLDEAQAQLKISRQLQRITGKGLQLVPLKTKAARRTLPLSEEALALFAAHRERQALFRAAAGDQWQEHDLIFPSSIGTPLDPRNLHRKFKKLLADHGLREIRVHDLRHSCAAIMFAQGMHPKAVSELLGHASIEITLKYYGHLIPKFHPSTAEIMDDLLNKGDAK